MEDLSALAANKLHASAITLDQAKYAGILALSATNAGNLYTGAPKAPCLQLRYCDPIGKLTKLYRLRILSPPVGFTLAKPQRYYQPPSTLPGAYFPKVKGVNWLELLSNPAHTLLITEGELKALSATLHGIPTIGLGGVWNWKSSRAGIDLLDELKAVNWEQRIVMLCYDSDSVTKVDVMRAQLALAQILSDAGAQVYDAGMPELPNLEKTGLDDYIVLRGVKALRTHLDESEPVKQTRALHDFNQKYLYVRNMDMVIEQRTSAMHAGKNFCARVAANEKYQIQTFVNGTPKMVTRPLAKAWIEWPRRAEVLALDYAPGQGRITEPGPNFNTWKGWGCVPKTGNVKPWIELLNFIFSQSETEAREWFVRWCAYPLQHPGAKLFTAVAVWGAGQGTGKTLLGETLLQIYGSNSSLITKGDLESNFNDWLDAKQFILGDEVTGNESRKHADQLKGLITSSTVSVNKKFQPRYELPNRVNLYFTSNHPDMFFLEDTDRRMMVIEAPADPLPLKFYSTYDAWMHKQEGPAALFQYLLDVDLGDWNPRAPAPWTEAKKLMIEDNKSDVGDWVLRLKRDAMSVLPLINGNVPREIFSTHELLAFYDPQGTKRISANGLGRELKRAGFKYICDGQPIISSGHAQARYYAVINTGRWRRAKRTDAKKHLEKHTFGNIGNKF